MMPRASKPFLPQLALSKSVQGNRAHLSYSSFLLRASLWTVSIRGPVQGPSTGPTVSLRSVRSSMVPGAPHPEAGASWGQRVGKDFTVALNRSATARHTHVATNSNPLPTCPLLPSLSRSTTPLRPCVLAWLSPRLAHPSPPNHTTTSSVLFALRRIYVERQARAPPRTM